MPNFHHFLLLDPPPAQEYMERATSILHFPVPTLHDNNINDVGANQSATRGGLVALQNQRNPVKFMDVADVAVWNPESGVRAQSGAGYEAELARISGMSDAERRAIEAAELAVEAKALEAEAAKSKALPPSRGHLRSWDLAYT